jgi:PAS domain S-box-containing protein
MKRDSFEFTQSVRLMEEAEQTLIAIRQGAVDAFVVEEDQGHRVYTLEGSDLPYHALVEGMQQGAAMLDSKGCIIYCNHSLSELLNVPHEKIIGMALADNLEDGDRELCNKLLNDTHTSPCHGEMRIRRADGTPISASFSFRVLSQVKSSIGVLVTDLTAHKQLAELAARLQGLQDEERRRIARELHDSVGQLLAAIGMNIGIVQAQAHKLDDKGARAVSDNYMLVEQVSREIRTISHLLHPPLLDLAGLASAIRWYVDGFSERSKIKVELEIPADFGRLPSEIEIAVFRVVQECLTNIHRHSGSPTATIRIHPEGEQLIIEVRDNGKGIAPEKQRELSTSTVGGVGFSGMRERLRLLGGKLDVQSGQTGTVVLATLKVA